MTNTSNFQLSFLNIFLFFSLADQSSNEYGQDIPVRRTDGKHSGPPFLPPQLLQVLLNKDTPAHVSIFILYIFSPHISALFLGFCYESSCIPILPLLP